MLRGPIFVSDYDREIEQVDRSQNRHPPFAVYNPIHYQERPQLFMDFICSLTGKSPATPRPSNKQMARGNLTAARDQLNRVKETTI